MVFVFLGPIVAIPFSRLTALKSLAQRAREKGWFLIPEERTTPLELQNLAGTLPGQLNQFFLTKRYAADYGLLQAILDPYINAVHVSLLRQRETVAIRTREYLGTLGERLLQDGPATLSVQEKNTVLWDPDSMMTLHRKLWRSPASDLHEWWQVAFRRYNESLELFVRRTVNSSG
jgi:membrane glycosyltransferase